MAMGRREGRRSDRHSGDRRWWGAFGGREWLDEVPTYPRNMMGDRGPLI
jgi:hypothetical protein